MMLPQEKPPKEKEKRPQTAGSMSDKDSTAGGRTGTVAAEGGALPPAATAEGGAAPPPPPPANDAIVGGGEFRSSADRRDGLVSGIHSFGVKRVRYSNVNGLGIFEGDINLGPVARLQKTKVASDATRLNQTLPASGSARRLPVGNVQHAVAITGQRYRWPCGLVPYELEAEIQPIVSEAITHWEQNTGIRFVLRTAANAASYPNYVSFEVRDGCFSAVGMQGGGQVISIGPGCGVGQAIHEIGHAVGLWHEQSREDRDRFVRIAWENIIENMEHNFDQHITDGDDIGDYDFDSIMHYPATAFSSNGLPTIEPIGGQPIGQRLGLSASDIAAIRELYPDAVGRSSHLYTSHILELVNAVGDQGFQSDGVGFYGLPLPVPGTVPLFRLSDPQGRQVYTASVEEASQAIATNKLTFDSVPCYLFASPGYGLAPLYELKNEAQNDSLLTTSPQEAQQAATKGYTGQGVAGHVLTYYVPGAVPVYRLSKAG